MVSVNPLEYMDFQKLYHFGGSLYKLVYIYIWIIVYLWAYIGVCKQTTSNIKPTSKVETGTNPEAFPETLACALYVFTSKYEGHSLQVCIAACKLLRRVSWTPLTHSGR